MDKDNWQQIGDVFSKKEEKKPPAHEWQELALRIIQELGIPNFKRSAVFKVCKENSVSFIQICVNDTKELCKEGQKWQYFFKLISQKD